MAVSPIAKKFDDWYLPSIRLLTEIALKAMSPGINDPGTAMDVMDRLTGLLGRLMNIPIYNFYQSAEGGEVWLASRDFGYILQDVMQQLRTYCREDVMVTRRLLQMLYHLLGATGNGYILQQAIKSEIRKLVADARVCIHNPGDRLTIAEDIFLHRSRLRQFLEETDYLGDPRLAERGLVLGD